MQSNCSILELYFKALAKIIRRVLLLDIGDQLSSLLYSFCTSSYMQIRALALSQFHSNVNLTFIINQYSWYYFFLLILILNYKCTGFFSSALISLLHNLKAVGSFCFDFKIVQRPFGSEMKRIGSL